MENDKRLEKVDVILNHNRNTKEYFSSFSDEAYENGWITIMNDQHPAVLKYFESVGEAMSLFKASEGGWINPIWTDV